MIDYVYGSKGRETLLDEPCVCDEFIEAVSVIVKYHVQHYALVIALRYTLSSY
jgi:hypothetical protein